MTHYQKYPRTFHLPWSLGATSDDRVHQSMAFLEGEEVVVTEKADGENFTIHADGHAHPRSVDGAAHPSQKWVRREAARVAPLLPTGWRVCGESLYARHAIAYDNLPSYYLGFSLYDERNWSLSWAEVEEWCALLDLHTVPVLYRGIWDEAKIRSLYPRPSALGGECEGYVVRLARSFAYEEFASSVAKFVRANHVPEGTAHWRHAAITPNRLMPASKLA